MVPWSWSRSARRHNVDEEKQSSGSRNFLKFLVDPAHPSVDIVAVHGLNPLDKQSHAEATWTTGGKLWLRDFLPKRVPDARIMIFGYNANVAFQTAAAGVREQAENLLNLLEEARTMDPNRPCIFICHSLGGLIVKRALVHANTDRTYGMILKCTFGIAFLATPHEGGNHAGMGDVVAKVARSILGSPSNNFMSALKTGSLFLDTITDDFRQLLEDFQILSFYETQPLGRFGIVVNQKSATLSLPGSREKRIPCDADHRNICKFDHENDPRYQQLADNLVKMINKACSPRWNPRPTSSSTENSSNIEGELNATLQAGYGNQSRTYGDTNETRQFGEGNNSETVGNGNITTQITMGAASAGRYEDVFKSFVNF
ncbi:hypothetical protein F5Y13DRAFT_169327 [Hypoxylon sp. FL1857]|nr:hypothetical protein F5Y13DRAFT_169327 [Hypoxylon sp. FL1857]